MCGFVGIKSNTPVIEDLNIALLTLQHRGQDGAGVVIWNGKKLCSQKYPGLVSRLFESDMPDMQTGIMGIGQVRYPTVGLNTPEELQPMANKRNPDLAMVHNGNIVNVEELRTYLKNEFNYGVSSQSDLEVILGLVIVGLEKFGDLENAIRLIEEKCIGGYSFCGILGDTMFAYRDSRSIRPFSYSYNDTKFGFASESIALKVLGFKTIENLEGGTLIVVDKTGTVTKIKIATNKPSTCFFEWIYFSSVNSILESKSVYLIRRALGAKIAKRIVLPAIKSGEIKIDTIAAVPESSRTAAISVSEVLKIQNREILIKNRYIQRTFILNSPEKRNRALSSKLQTIDCEIEGKSLLIVDDSIVRGATGRKMIKQLREAGAKNVYLMVLCPPICHPCFYGIDFPDPNELIAYNHTLEEVTKDLGADHIFYPNENDIKEVLGENCLCLACINGKYPTDIKCAQNFCNSRNVDRRRAENVII